MTTGERIKDLRISRGFKGNIFSKSLKISASYLSRVERGVNEPSDTLLSQIEARYGIRMEWLKTGKGPKAAPSIAIGAEGVKERNGAYASARFPKALMPLLAEVVKIMQSDDDMPKKALEHIIHTLFRTVKELEISEKYLSPNDPPGGARAT
jgi:transcriptional regulator with XRE-family HTH domain